MIGRMILIGMTLALGGCAISGQQVAEPMEPQSDVLELCEAGQFHAAMRALPATMQAWDEYTKRSGNTAEGAAGYEYMSTMLQIAARGDADWGKILDDPDIPYEYKTNMIFEIMETRLGKGAVYMGDDNHLIVPRRKPINLDTERIILPKQEH